MDSFIDWGIANAEPWAARHVEPAFRGDAEAAFSLVCALGNSNRGRFAVEMMRASVQKDAYRAFFGGAWEHDHFEVIEAAGDWLFLREMFLYAEFSKPEHLPETVRIWRGTHGLTADEARRGISWTVDRDVACDFAFAHGRDYGRLPLVIVAEISRSEILFYTNDRNEQEVVVFDVAKASVDGGPDDWAEGRNRYRATCATPTE